MYALNGDRDGITRECQFVMYTVHPVIVVRGFLCVLIQIPFSFIPSSSTTQLMHLSTMYISLLSFIDATIYTLTDHNSRVTCTRSVPLRFISHS